MGIDLQKRSFVVVERKEQWCPNGDGELYARLSFSLASEENIKDFIMQMLSNGAKELPMTNFSYEYSTNLDQYSKSACQGYYLIKVDSTDSRNYCLITFDKIKKESAIQIEIY